MSHGHTYGANTCDTVPVKLAEAAFSKGLLCGGNVVTGWKIGDDLFSNPASLELSRLGVGESPFQVLHSAIVCELLSKIGRILPVNAVVGAS